MAVIAIDNVGKTYGTHAVLDGVSFSVPEGRCLALIGHNGAGKTTLMKLILGLITPTCGKITVLGCDPARAGKEFRHALGFLPENVAFHDELTGTDTLTFYARLKGLGWPEVRPLLDRVGLLHAAERRVKTYSKGMRQRLGLAQALLGQPKLLLLDEPTTGLDPVSRQEFFGIIRDLTAGGTSVILSSHILTELEAQTNFVAILREGQLAAFGDLDVLRAEANLPVSVRIKGNAPAIAQGLNGSYHKVLGPDRGSIEVDCPAVQKMALLRTLADFGELCSDIEVRVPSLDDLYLHYSGRPSVTIEETGS